MTTKTRKRRTPKVVPAQTPETNGAGNAPDSESLDSIITHSAEAHRIVAELPGPNSRIKAGQARVLALLEEINRLAGRLKAEE